MRIGDDGFITDNGKSEIVLDILEVGNPSMNDVIMIVF